MANGFQGNSFRLNDNCLIFKYCKADGSKKGFLLNLTTPARFHTSCEATLMLLDLLVREQDDQVIKYDDLINHLLNQYQLDRARAMQILDRFLTFLQNHGFLKDRNQIPNSQEVPVSDYMYCDLGSGRRAPEEATIQGGSTLFSLGYVVTRYRP